MTDKDKPFQDNLDVVVLKNGEEITLPRLTIGKIMTLTDAMNDLIKAAKEKAPVIFEMFGGDKPASSPELIEAIPQLIPILINQVVTVLALYTGKEENWIKDNMDMEDLVAVATPFFAGTFKQANHVLKPLGEMLRKAQVEQPKSPSKKS